MKKIIVLALSAVFLVGAFAVATPVSAVTLQELQNQIQSLLGQVKSLQAQNQTANVTDSAAGTTASWCFNFKTNLRRGDTGKAVANLHIALQKEGYAIDKGEINNKRFGDSTKSAVIGFQNKYASEVLTPLDKTSGTGFVGNTTRAKLNQLYGCGGTVSAVTTVTPTTTTTTTIAPSTTPETATSATDSTKAADTTTITTTETVTTTAAEASTVTPTVNSDVSKEARSRQDMIKKMILENISLNDNSPLVADKSLNELFNESLKFLGSAVQSQELSKTDRQYLFDSTIDLIRQIAYLKVRTPFNGTLSYTDRIKDLVALHLTRIFDLNPISNRQNITNEERNNIKNAVKNAYNLEGNDELIWDKFTILINHNSDELEFYYNLLKAYPSVPILLGDSRVIYRNASWGGSADKTFPLWTGAGTIEIWIHGVGHNISGYLDKNRNINKRISTERMEQLMAQIRRVNVNCETEGVSCIETSKHLPAAVMNSNTGIMPYWWASWPELLATLVDVYMVDSEAAFKTALAGQNERLNQFLFMLDIFSLEANKGRFYRLVNSTSKQWQNFGSYATNGDFIIMEVPLTRNSQKQITSLTVGGKKYNFALDSSGNVLSYSVENILTPSITVLSPNGGEKWEVGKIYEVKWKTSNAPTGSFVNLIARQAHIVAEGLSPTQGSHSWTIPAHFQPDPDYKIDAILSTSTIRWSTVASDESDNFFTILPKTGVPTIHHLSPFEGPIGTEVFISGSGFGPYTSIVVQFGPVAIYAPTPLKDGRLAFVVPQSGPSSCTIDGTCTKDLVQIEPGKTYPVKVINANGESNSVNFTVTGATTPSITVVSPNGGERWEKGSDRTIWFSSFGTMGKKTRILLVDKNNFENTWSVLDYIIADFTGKMEGESIGYPWKVGDARQVSGSGAPAPGQYKIKICVFPDGVQGDSSNITCDNSDAPFNILKKGSGSGLTPNQINAIINLLKVFGANQSTIDKVKTALE